LNRERDSKEVVEITDESNLIKMVAEGNSNAISQFYHAHVDQLYGTVFNQVGRDHNVTQEIIQDTFLAAIKSAHNFEGKSSVYTWLYSIARRKIADYYRSKYRIRQIQFDPEADVETIEDSAVASTDPVANIDDTEAIRQAINSLPLHYKEIILLKYIDEMSVEEIGIATDRSVKSVEGILSRARKILKEKILKMGMRVDGTLKRLAR